MGLNHQSKALIITPLVALFLCCEPTDSQSTGPAPTPTRPPPPSENTKGTESDKAPQKKAVPPKSAVVPLETAAKLHHLGDSEKAENILRKAIAAGARLERTLLGKYLVEQQRYNDAIETLAGGVPKDTVLDLTSYYLGQALRATGRPLEAVKHFAIVAKAVRSPLSPNAGFRLGDAYFEGDDCKSALKHYETLLNRYPDYPQKNLVSYRMAVCHERAGRLRKAVAIYDDLVMRKPDCDAALASDTRLTLLAQQGIERPKKSIQQQAEWGFELRKTRQWARAVPVLRSLLTKTKGKLRGQVAYELAWALDSLERYPEALPLFDTAKRFGHPVRLVLSRKAKTLRKMGRTKEAVKLIERITRGGKRAKMLASAYVYAQDGHYRRALAMYQRSGATVATNPELRWVLAWLQYRTKHYRTASRRFAELLKSKTLRRFKARYWLARSLAKDRKKARAVVHYEFILRHGPMDYYGIQAANRLLEIDPARYYQMTGAKPEQAATAQIRQKKGAYIYWNGDDGTTSWSEKPFVPKQTLFTDAVQELGTQLPQLSRAHDRIKMGLYDLARLELRVALSDVSRARQNAPKTLANQIGSLYTDHRKTKRGLWGSNPRGRLSLDRDTLAAEESRYRTLRALPKTTIAKLRQLLQAAGDYYWDKRQTLSNNRQLLRRPPTKATQEAYKRVFSLVHERALRRHTEFHNLSPFLMAAMARVESGYNPLAISTAGARGLLQIMPVTGNLIAGRRHQTEFSAATLLNPDINIDYSTWYMNQLLEKFSGQEPLAILSYNAGPHRIQQWVARRGKLSDLDEFIEEVPYREARRYVKRVIQYAGQYRRSWTQRNDLWVGQKIDSRYKDNINW